MLLLINDEDAVDEHIVDPLGITVGVVLKWVGIREKTGRSIADTFQVKNDNVRSRPRAEHAAVI